jgi:multidrug efflux pump subunit AcrB
VQQIGAALRPFVGGDQTNRWLAPDGQNYEVNVQLPKSGRQKVADLADLSVASSKLDAAATRSWCRCARWSSSCPRPARRC